jgi:hypothetical protein
VEVDRLVNGIGGVTLLNQLILVGSPLAGQRARLRLDGQLMHVLTQDGLLWHTLPCPIPPGQRHRLQGARQAGPAPLPDATATVQRRVSSRGGIQVARQRIHVGMTHAGKIVTVIPPGQQLPAGHRRRHRHYRAPHHQPPDRPLLGLRHPPAKAVTPCPK